MAVNPSQSPLVAVDANVLFDLADELDDVVDAVSLIRDRLSEAKLLIPPTAQHELANWALRGGTTQKRQTAQKAIRVARTRRILPANLIAVSHGITERIARRLRDVELLPEEELHDAFICVRVCPPALFNPADQRRTFARHRLRTADV